MYTYDSSFIFVFHTQQSYTTNKSKVLLSSPTAVNTVNISLFLVHELVYLSPFSFVPLLLSVSMSVSTSSTPRCVWPGCCLRSICICHRDGCAPRAPVCVLYEIYIVDIYTYIYGYVF